jgi:hypothetical protein
MKVFIIYTLILILSSLVLFVSYVNPKINKVFHIIDLAKTSREYINPDNLNLNENEMDILIKDERTSKNINLIVTKFYNQFLSPLIKKDLGQE